MMIQKNLGLGICYAGFLFGNTIIINSAFSHEHHDISSYLIQVILKILLAILIHPLFRIGLQYIFKIDEEMIEDPHTSQEIIHLGSGVYMGAIFLTCSFLTSIIIGQIHFGTIYPFF